MITAAVIGLIGSLVATGVGLYSSSKQQEALATGQQESKQLYEQQQIQQGRETAFSQSMQKKQLAENQREFNATADWQKKQAQFDRLNGILDKNENLKNLFVSRIAGLRR